MKRRETMKTYRVEIEALAYVDVKANSEKEAKEMTPKYFSENRKDADGMVFYEECDWKKATVIEQ
jgi:hypothetical protein